MKQLRLWLLGLFALCGIAAVAQEAKADSTGYIVKVAWPMALVILCAPVWFKSSRFR